MNISDFLRIDGTDQFSILCYALFLKGNINHENMKQWQSISNCVKYEKYIFENYEWKYDVFLTESYFFSSSEMDLFNLIKNEILNISQLNPVAIICMFDGAFSDLDYLKDEEIIQQIYAFWSKNIGLYIAEDTNILHSNDWVKKIRCLYKHMEI